MALEPSTSSPPGRVLARLARQVEVALGGVEGDDALSLPQYRLLGHLAEVDAPVSSALAERLLVSKPSVTAVVDGLEARGFVERRGCADDRRRVELHITTAGVRALEAADTAVDARLGDLADRLSPAERRRADTGVAAWGVALNRTRVARLQGADR